MTDQRTFLVTGASRGIGRAVSERLAAAGHHVIGIARRADDSDFRGTLISVDLTDRQQTEDAFHDISERYGIDGIVNNVGLVRPQALGDIDLDALDAVLRLNLHPAIQAVQAALPRMRASAWGRIVNISSLTVLGIAERTAYAAAKAALVSFTRTWALELARTGITTSTLWRPARPEPNCFAPTTLRAARGKNDIWPAFPCTDLESRTKSRRQSSSSCQKTPVSSPVRRCLLMAAHLSARHCPEAFASGKPDRRAAEPSPVAPQRIIGHHSVLLRTNEFL
ncbi:SDR family NAD(P)-dependent oxidoreductase [Sinorhizobium meliloti]|uniref:SDR family NAD(P)-dependent oxidoreductase n=1 Tax=Rhizobium meliloti TaxID=382 RepID=UPI00237F539A|nr:SDR family NAD(P)-dependent oxidoreductase [Sinorhizobium meliloti]